MGYARLQEDEFGVEAVLAELRGDPRVGGVTLYVGSVRRDDDGRTVESLTYEAYGEMATVVLERLRTETIERHGLVDAILIHRVGRFGPGEPVLLVALAGAHRGETYDAVRDLMDRLKQDVPIWKKETSKSGERWILGAERRTVAP